MNIGMMTKNKYYACSTVQKANMQLHILLVSKEKRVNYPADKSPHTGT